MKVSEASPELNKILELITKFKSDLDTQLEKIADKEEANGTDYPQNFARSSMEVFSALSNFSGFIEFAIEHQEYLR